MLDEASVRPWRVVEDPKQMEATLELAVSKLIDNVHGTGAAAHK